VSRRDAIVRATAGALQAKAIDLTKYRQRTASIGRPVYATSEVAAGALAFSGQDLLIDGERVKGNELAPILLRLKYAWQRNKGSFGRAHLLFLRRHKWDPKHPSLVFYALAMVAIFEWVHDHCPDCRFKKKAGKGMQCSKCGNSGRKPFPFAQRLAFTNDFVASAGGLHLTKENFRAHWLARYQELLDDLKEVDHYIAAGIDLKFKPNQNRSTIPEPRDSVADQAEGEPERAKDAPGLASGSPRPRFRFRK
jgi:hypothetical protein